MSLDHDLDNFEFKKSFDTGIYDKLQETEGWLSMFREKIKNRDYKSVKKNDPLLEKLLLGLGYFGLIRDRLRDEVLFNKDTLRALNLQIKRLENGLESRKSEIGTQFELKKTAVQGYEKLKTKRENADRNSRAYVEIQGDYFKAKKDKESAEQGLRRNALVYQNVYQAVELMKVSLEQGRLYLQQGKEVLEKVERTLEEMTMVYNAATVILQSKQELPQITGRENDTKK